MHSLDKHGKMCRYLTHRECGNKTNMYVISSYTLIQASCRGFPDVPQEKIMLILRIENILGTMLLVSWTDQLLRGFLWEGSSWV